MKAAKFLFQFLLVIMATACGDSELPPKDYVGWCDDPENKLIKEYSQGPLTLTCQYMSPEYTVLKQSNPDELDEKEIKDNVKSVADLVQFKFKFENDETNNFLRDNYTTAEDFNVRSLYISYGMLSDLKLVVNSDTAECLLMHHERTYGNTPYETVLLSFSKLSHETSDFEVIFDDRVFGFGRVKFFYEREIFNRIPRLNLKQ